MNRLEVGSAQPRNRVLRVIAMTRCATLTFLVSFLLGCSHSTTPAEATDQIDICRSGAAVAERSDLDRQAILERADMRLQMAATKAASDPNAKEFIRACAIMIRAAEQLRIVLEMAGQGKNVNRSLLARIRCGVDGLAEADDLAETAVWLGATYNDEVGRVAQTSQAKPEAP